MVHIGKRNDGPALVVTKLFGSAPLVLNIVSLISSPMLRVIVTLAVTRAVPDSVSLLPLSGTRTLDGQELVILLVTRGGRDLINFEMAEYILYCYLCIQYFIRKLLKWENDCVIRMTFPNE